MVSTICYFQPYLGKISNLTNMFSNGLKPPSRTVRAHSKRAGPLKRDDRLSKRQVFCGGDLALVLGRWSQKTFQSKDVFEFMYHVHSNVAVKTNQNCTLLDII